MKFRFRSFYLLPALFFRALRLCLLLLHHFFRVEWLVLDEGDKLFEAGENGFKEQVIFCNFCDKFIHI